MRQSVHGLDYWSDTFDVIAWPESDEGDVRVVASFTTRDDGNAYLRAHADTLVLRPPRAALAHALAWVAYVGALANGELSSEIRALRPAY